MTPKAVVGRSFGAIYVPIDSVFEHPLNYREHDEGAIAHSIEHLGAGEAWRALVVQESSGYVIVGNGQLKAHRLRCDAEVPVLFRNVDDDMALAILLADNWTASRGRNMPAELLAVMRELQDERELFEATGADADDLEALEKEVRDLGEPLDLGPKKKAKPAEVQCPNCGETFKPKGKR